MDTDTVQNLTDDAFICDFICGAFVKLVLYDKNDMVIKEIKRDDSYDNIDCLYTYGEDREGIVIFAIGDYVNSKRCDYICNLHETLCDGFINVSKVDLYMIEEEVDDTGTVIGPTNGIVEIDPLESPELEIGSYIHGLDDIYRPYAQFWITGPRRENPSND